MNIYSELIKVFDAKFRNEQKLIEHWESHKQDFINAGFNFKSANEYQNFADRESEKKIDNRSILGYKRPNGDVVKWNSGNNWYSIIASGNVLKSAFPLRGGKRRYEDLKKRDIGR